LQRKEDLQGLAKEFQRAAKVFDPSFFQLGADFTVCGLSKQVSTLA
jgi:hypothetical protein